MTLLENGPLPPDLLENSHLVVQLADHGWNFLHVPDLLPCIMAVSLSVVLCSYLSCNAVHASNPLSTSPPWVLTMLPASLTPRHFAFTSRTFTFVVRSGTLARCSWGPCLLCPQRAPCHHSTTGERFLEHPRPCSSFSRLALGNPAPASICAFVMVTSCSSSLPQLDLAGDTKLFSAWSVLDRIMKSWISTADTAMSGSSGIQTDPRSSKCVLVSAKSMSSS